MSTRKPPSKPKQPAVEDDEANASEWEHGQHTPEVGTDAMTALVKESATRTPPAGVPLAGGKTAARTVKRAGTKGGKSGTKRTAPAPARSKRARTQTPATPVEVTAPVDQNEIPTVPVPKFEPEPPASPAIVAPTVTPAPTQSTAPPSGAVKRPGSTTLSPTAFIRPGGDTVPPLSTGARTSPPRAAARKSTMPPPLPLPRAAAAVALGDVPIEDEPAAQADDDEPSALAALLTLPIGEERRARKATLPPPPLQMFPVAEEVAQDLPPVAVPRPSSAPRNLAIAVGGLAVLIAVLVFALRGGDDKAKVVAPAAEPPTPAAAETPTPVETVPVAEAPSAPVPEVPVATATTGSATGSAAEVDIEIEEPAPEGPAAPPPVAAAGSATTTAPASATPTTPTSTETPPVAKPRSALSALLKNKEVVLEYDGRIGKNSAPASDQAAIAKARAAQAAGTQKLNTRDYDGALDSYRQALSHYAGYIGAYRGMGLAYDRKGDKVNALKALRMYVSIVPNATDVPALRKRIDALSKR